MPQILFFILFLYLVTLSFKIINGVVIIKWTRKIRENEKGHNYEKKVLFKRI